MHRRLIIVCGLALLGLLALPASRAQGNDPGASSKRALALLRKGDLTGATESYEESRSEAWTPERGLACDALADAWTNVAGRRESRVQRCRELCSVVREDFRWATAELHRAGATLADLQRRLDVLANSIEVYDYGPHPGFPDPPPWHPPEGDVGHRERDTLEKKIAVAREQLAVASKRYDRCRAHVERIIALLRRAEKLWLDAVDHAATYHTEALNLMSREERQAEPDRLLLAADLNRQAARLKR